MRKSVAVEKIEREIAALPVNVFNEIVDTATDVGIKDWSRNHNHYLYGTDKR